MANLKAGSTIGGEAVLTAGNISSYNLNFLNGNVGIGTTSPDARLTIAQLGTIGGVDLTKACILAGNSTTGIGIDDNEIIKKQGAGGGQLNIGSQGSAASIKFKTGANGADGNVPYDRMIIDSAGNVGIGTTNPKHILDVRLSEDLTTFVGNQTPGVGIKNANTAVDNVALLAFKGSQADTVLAGVGMINRNISTTSGASVGDLAFYSKPSGQSNLNDDPSMIIDSEGNVGIGTTSPDAPLHIKTSNTTDTLLLESTGDSNLNAPDLILYRNSATPADADNLGIIKFRGVNDGTVGVNRSDIDYALIQSEIIDASNNAEKGSLSFWTRGVGSVDKRMTIDSDGNVGIGTSSPGNFSGLNFNTTTLDVAGMIQIKSTTDGVAVLQIGGDTYRKASIFTPISTSDPYMAFAVSTSGTSSSANEAVRITSAGNVGIGTTTPEGKLEIEHTGSWDNPSIHLKGQYPTMKFNDTNAEDDWYIHVNSNNFYLLVDRDASGDEAIDKATNVWETPHPLQLEGGTNKGYLFANEIITAGNVGNFAQTSAFNGGTVTSAITIQNTNPIFTLKDTNGGDVNSQSGYIDFTDNNNTSRGWVGFGSTGDKIISIRNNIGGINLITDTGATVQANSSRVFTDAYHPNADQWTTSRTLSLGGDLSGSVSINGGSNATLTATVTDGSHNHSAGNITSGTLDSARIPAATSTNLGGVKVSYNATSQTLSITTT